MLIVTATYRTRTLQHRYARNMLFNLFHLVLLTAIQLIQIVAMAKKRGSSRQSFSCYCDRSVTITCKRQARDDVLQGISPRLQPSSQSDSWRDIRDRWQSPCREMGWVPLATTSLSDEKRNSSQRKRCCFPKFFTSTSPILYPSIFYLHCLLLFRSLLEQILSVGDLLLYVQLSDEYPWNFEEQLSLAKRIYVDSNVGARLVPLTSTICKLRFYIQTHQSWSDLIDWVSVCKMLHLVTTDCYCLLRLFLRFFCLVLIAFSTRTSAKNVGESESCLRETWSIWHSRRGWRRSIPFPHVVRYLLNSMFSFLSLVL